MKKLRFRKIDAFASGISAGNPAAVVYLDQQNDLSEAEKLRIAKELKGCVSEVGYASPGTETDYELRYYSSEREVAFCGHATIAIMNDLVANNEAMQSRTELTIATRTARLAVENRYRDEKSVYVSAPPPKFADKKIDPAEIASALNCPLDTLDQSHPIQIVNGGLETLIVPTAGLAPILDVSPEPRKLKEFCLEMQADIVLLYSREVAFPESRYRTRVFAPVFGYLEDPATGSGNSAFGYYLLAQGLWQGEKMRIEQNGFRDTPNFVRLFSRGDGGKNARVWFGGGAIVRLDGQYILE